MGPRARIAIVAAVLAAGGVTGLLVAGNGSGSGGDVFVQGSVPGTPLPTSCLDLPGEVAPPAWFPDDLPLPDGSYVSAVPDQRAEGINQVVFTAKGSLDDFVRFVLERWEDAGWSLGRGEREPGEAESIFFTEGTERYGQFRARQVYCDQGYTEVQLYVVLDAASVPAPTAAPRSS